MADEMQEIESRLAAYVDGTLPEHQRAEIEAYLKANATHGRLIAELRSIKAAVSTLPREKAPAEVLDGLQAHLERHQLLEGVEESVGSSRIQRWPQIGAMAAVLMLAAGLGILVYVVLPTRKGPPPELAMLPEALSTQPIGSDEVPAGGASLKDAMTANTDASTDKRLQQNENPYSNGVAAPRAIDTDIAARRQAPGQQMYQNQFGTPAQQDAAPSFGGGAGLPPAAMATSNLGKPSVATTFPVPPALQGPTRVLTITTDDPAITANLMAGYFAQTQLNYERVASVDSLTASAEDGIADRFKRPESKAGEAATQPQALGIDSVLADSQAANTPAAKSAPSKSPATPPNEVVLLRDITPEQLAEVEAALRLQRASRQRADARWLGEASPPAEVQAKRPTTQSTEAGPSLPTPIYVNGQVVGSLPPAVESSARTAGEAQPATQPASPTTTASAASKSNLIVVVVPAPAEPPATTQPIAPPAAVELPATLPTTQP